MLDTLRADLTAAIKARDAVAVAALRSVLAAIGNAESVPADGGAHPGEQSTTIAGAVVGLGAGEAERRPLTDTDMLALLRAEIAERRSAADALDGVAGAHAHRLRAEADVLARYLPSR